MDVRKTEKMEPHRVQSSIISSTILGASHTLQEHGETTWNSSMPLEQ